MENQTLKKIYKSWFTYAGLGILMISGITAMMQVANHIALI